MELILKYFPNLSEQQKTQFAALYDLYTDWNSKINVISRKDITNLYEHHVLHSLGRLFRREQACCAVSRRPYFRTLYYTGWRGS